jgi:hypothetical protein
MLDIEQLEFSLESKWTGRKTNTPALSVSRISASLNMALVNLLDTTQELYYQIARSGDKDYLIIGYTQFANQSYKLAKNISPDGKIQGLSMGVKDVFTKYGPKQSGDKIRYDLNQVPIKGNLFAFEMVKVFTDSVQTIEH